MRVPPDEKRCTALTRYWPSGDPGPRCNRLRDIGLTVCAAHRENSKIVYHAPPDERRCSCTSKKTGERCTQWAMRGQTVCYWHGGSATQTRKAADRRIKEDALTKQANRLLVSLGADPVDNPLTALSELAGEVLAFKEALGQRVNELDAIRYQDDKGGEQLRAEVALYERAVAQAGNLLGQIAKLNIDERLAAINERQAGVVIAAIEAALAHAGVTGEAATRAKQVAARRLRSV
jgi:hypothetical protein